jgi:hypothetical protein
MAGRCDSSVCLAIELRGLHVDNDGPRTQKVLFAALRFEGQRSGRLDWQRRANCDAQVGAQELGVGHRESTPRQRLAEINNVECCRSRSCTEGDSRVEGAAIQARARQRTKKALQRLRDGQWQTLRCLRAGIRVQPSADYGSRKTSCGNSVKL